MSDCNSLSEVYLGAEVATKIVKVYRGNTLIFERGVGPVLDPATQALLDQAATDGFTAASGAVLTALNTFIVQLKADLIWDKLDVLYVFATNGDSDFATYNLKDPTTFQATKVNSPVFTSEEGFTGDGSSAYLDTNFNLGTNGVNFLLNSASYGFYIRSGTLNASYGVGDAGSNTDFLNVYFPAGNNANFSVNSASSTITAGLLSSRAGFTVGNRESNSSISFYKDGGLIQNFTNNSAGVPILNTYKILAVTISTGVTLGHADDQVSMGFLGGSLSSGDNTNIYNAIQTYMTTLGTQV